jgi:O-antigen ligase
MEAGRLVPGHGTLPRRRLWRGILMAALLLALTYLLARAPLTWAVAVLVLAIGGVLLLRQPTLGLYLFPWTVPFGSLREFSLGGVMLGASEVVLLATVAAWLLHMMAFRRVRLRAARVLLALGLYIGTLALSLLPAQALVPAATTLAKWIEFGLLYVLVASETTPTQRKLLLASLLLAGLVEGLVGINQFLRQIGPPGFILFGRYMRAYGTFRQPNPFGGYMGLLLPGGYAVLLASPARPWRRESTTPGDLALWLLALLATAIMLVALIMSWSRGALLGLAVGATLVALTWGGRRLWALLIVVLPVVILLGPELLALLPTDLLQRLVEIVDYAGRDLTRIEVTDANFALIERAAHWAAAWRLFARRPWLGVGTGQYAVRYGEVAFPRWQDPLGHAHNYYLNILAEGGLIGLTGYLVLQASLLIHAWRAALRTEGWPRVYALGALGMVGHLLAHNLFDNLYVHEIYLAIALIMGLVTAAQMDANDTPE